MNYSGATSPEGGGAQSSEMQDDYRGVIGKQYGVVWNRLQISGLAIEMGHRSYIQGYLTGLRLYMECD